jgi:tetraacyldisaccharide 4'-kinase
MITTYNAFYKYNILSSWSFDNSIAEWGGASQPILVSIGNISLGGSAKTPMTIYFSKLLHQYKIKHVVVSRGYKKKLAGTVVVSDGFSLPSLDAEQCGDEPYLLATKLPTTPIVVDEDKRRAINCAWEKFKPNIILVDDGFQSLYLKFDYHVVVHNATMTKSDMRLFPAGKLREPVSEIKRADIIILTKPCGEYNHYKHLSLYNKNIINSTSKTSLLLWNQAKNLLVLNESSLINNKKIYLFCGLADGNSFFDSAKKHFGNIVSKKKYHDHFDYLNSSFFLKDCQNAINKGAELFVTSYKDFVKIKNHSIIMDLPVAWQVVDIEYIVDTKKLDSFMSLIHGVSHKT